jgi:hypothetical protein
MGVDYVYSGDGGAVAVLTFFIIYGVIILASLLIGVAYYVVTAFAFMSLYRKVGIKPWIAWVPYYNYWVWLELGGQRGWLALLSVVPYGGIVTLVFLGIGSYRTGIAFRRDGSYVVLALLLPFVWAFILGGRNSVYEPELITARGYPPPLAGRGSVVANYATAAHRPPRFAAPPAA